MKVLLAIDGSRHSEAAVAEVARRPWPAGTEVKILTVIHPTVPVFPDAAFAIAAIHVEQAEELVVTMTLGRDGRVTPTR